MTARMRVLALTAWSLLACPLLAQTPAPGQIDPNIKPASATGAAAIVNGETITQAELKKLIDQRPYPVALSEDQKKAVQKAALDMLIDDLLLKQFLRKQVPNVDPADYKREFDELQQGLKKQQKTLEVLLKETGQTEEQLRADLLASVQWKTLVKQQMPEEKLKAYYDANKVFFDQVLVTASHILLKLPPNASDAQKQQARERLLALRAEILAGKTTFAAAAKAYSECPSKEKGGSLGQFPYKFVVVEPFARAAFSTKVGEISDVVSTEFGVHLIHVTDRTAGQATNYEQMREIVRGVWAQEADLHSRIVAEQRKSGKIEITMP